MVINRSKSLTRLDSSDIKTVLKLIQCWSNSKHWCNQSNKWTARCHSMTILITILEILIVTHFLPNSKTKKQWLSIAKFGFIPNRNLVRCLSASNIVQCFMVLKVPTAIARRINLFIQSWHLGRFNLNNQSSGWSQ